MEIIKVKSLELLVKRSEKRSSALIEINPAGELIVRVPAKMPIAEVERLALRKLDWIENQIEEKQIALRRGDDKNLQTGSEVFILGTGYYLEVRESQVHSLRKAITENDRVIVLKGSDIKLALIELIECRLINFLNTHVERFAQRMGVCPSKHEVSDLGKKWAACTPEKNIYFHWRVGMLPAHAIDYLIVHELAHLKISGHGPDFWRLVSRVIPDWKERRQWLAAKGPRFNL